MLREGTKHLHAIVKKYCDEISLKSLPWVATLSLDDQFTEESQQPGKQASGQPGRRPGSPGSPGSRATGQPGSRATERPGSRAAGQGIERHDTLVTTEWSKDGKSPILRYLSYYNSIVGATGLTPFSFFLRP